MIKEYHVNNPWGRSKDKSKRKGDETVKINFQKSKINE